jgi:hypothetical protein
MQIRVLNTFANPPIAMLTLFELLSEHITMAFFDMANVLSVKFAMKILELVSKSLIFYLIFYLI